MFGGKKKPKDATPPQQGMELGLDDGDGAPQIDYALINEALNGPDEIHVDVNDNDMADPSLLSELESVLSGGGGECKSQSPSPYSSSASSSSVVGLSAAPAGAPLYAIPPQYQQPQSQQHYAIPQQQSFMYVQQPQPMSAPSLNTERIVALQQSIAMEQEQYAFFKSQNEREECREIAERIKKMQIELSLLGVHAPSVKAPPQPTLVPGPAVGAAPSPGPIVSQQTDVARLTAIAQERNTHWRARALYFKKRRDVAQAKAAIQNSLQCKRALEALSIGVTDVTLPDAPPPLPSSPADLATSAPSSAPMQSSRATVSASAPQINTKASEKMPTPVARPISPSLVDNSGSVRAPAEGAVAEQQRLQQFLAIEQALKEQSTRLFKLAKEALEKGDKHLAVLLNRERKQLLSDLEQVTEARKFPGALLPAYHYEVKKHQRERTFTKLGPDELEVAVFAGYNLSSKDYPKISPYVEVCFAYPPEKEQKFKTPIVKESYDPTWKVSHRFLIDRKKRTLLRFCERKKLLLKVYHSRFFGKDAVIATGELELAPLLTQCEIREKVQLMEGRRKSNGLIEVRLRLRVPLIKKHVEVIEEKILRIDQHFPLPQKPPSPIPPVSPVKSPERQEDCRNQEADDDIQSLDLLKYYIGECNKEKAERQSFNLSYDDIDERKRQLEKKLDDISQQLKQQNLSLVLYYQTIAKAAENDTNEARKLRDENKVNDAIAALRRAKIADGEMKRLLLQHPNLELQLATPSTASTNQEEGTAATVSSSNTASPSPRVSSSHADISSTDANAPSSVSSPFPPSSSPLPSPEANALSSVSPPVITPAAPPASDQSTPATSSTPPPSKLLTRGVDGDYNTIDRVESNNVLEWMMEETRKAISLRKMKRMPPDDELETKLTKLTLLQMEIEAKMNVLVIKVQTGQLSEEDYVEIIETKIKEEKRLAQELNIRGNKAQAKLALLRAKIMQKELTEE